MSQIEPARPQFRSAKLLATTFLNIIRFCKETLMGKTKLAAVRVKMNRAGVTPDRTIPTATTYLNPDLFHIGSKVVPQDGSWTGEVWVPTGESTGLRQPDSKNVVSFRGAVQHHADNRKIVFESALEARVAKILLARRDIVEVRDQWPDVHHVDCGRIASHTFDFWARFADGRRVAIAVKPTSRVRSSGVLRTLKLISEQGNGNFADQVALITDAYATHDAAHEAGWKLHSRRMRNEDAYEEAFSLVSSIKGSVRFHDLLDGAAEPAARRIAIWNLIDEGHLVVLHPGRINDLTWLRRPSQN
ncbi:hypothetical protein ACWGPT_09440 [Pseudorhizobium sp. NPDC055634]